MKKSVTIYLTLIVALFLGVHAKAQAPQAIPYQAVVRNNAGNVIANKTIGIRFGIRDVSATGTLVYLEEQKVTTNALGLLVANVGQGTLVFGYQELKVINWQKGDKFLEVEVDTTGGTTYKSLGTQKLMSVPYALSAGDGVPVGTIVAFGGDTTKIPQGWVLCDGRPLSINDPKYVNLYNAIGQSWGTTGAGYFNLPGLQGLFLRGATNGTKFTYDSEPSSRVAIQIGGNSGDKVGSVQFDDFKSHEHNLIPAGASWAGIMYNSPGASYDFYSRTGGGWSIQNRSVTDAKGGTETRPKNAYVNYIIKY
jgi:microcystin-dependent protein